MPLPLAPGRYLSTEADGHAQHDRAARYFGPTRQRLERSARLKRWRRSRQPLAAPGSGGGGGDAALLGWRRPPAPTQQAAQGHAHPPRMQLPSPGFLPLKVEEDASPPAGLAGPRAAQQAGQAPGPQQRQFPTVSAAEELAAEQAAAAQRDGETSEEMLLRRTKEYNLASRERPYDIQLWLEFARFQVGLWLYGEGWWWWWGAGWGWGWKKPGRGSVQSLRCAGLRLCMRMPSATCMSRSAVQQRLPALCCLCLPSSANRHLSATCGLPPQDEAARLRPTRRGGERAVAEKKLSILEKALSLHPGSDELLLALLSTVSWGRGAEHWCMLALACDSVQCCELIIKLHSNKWHDVNRCCWSSAAHELSAVVSAGQSSGGGGGAAATGRAAARACWRAEAAVVGLPLCPP